MAFVPADDELPAVWQAWVEQGRSDEERYRRYARVPEPLQARVAAHMRTVKAMEAFLERRHAGRYGEDARVVAKGNRRIDRTNPNGF